MLAVARLGGVWSSCSPGFRRAGGAGPFRPDRSAGALRRRWLSLRGQGPHAFPGPGGTPDQGAVAPAWCAPWWCPTWRVRKSGPPCPPVSPFPGTITWRHPARRGALLSQRLPFDHPLYIMFSSGTTGLPKCMVHSAGGTLAAAPEGTPAALRPGAGRPAVLLHNLRLDDVELAGDGPGFSGAAVVLYDGHPLRPASGALGSGRSANAITVFGTSARHIAACAKEGLRPGRDPWTSRALRCVLSTGIAPACPNPSITFSST